MGEECLVLTKLCMLSIPVGIPFILYMLWVSLENLMRAYNIMCVCRLIHHLSAFAATTTTTTTTASGGGAQAPAPPPGLVGGWFSWFTWIGSRPEWNAERVGLQYLYVSAHDIVHDIVHAPPRCQEATYSLPTRDYTACVCVCDRQPRVTTNHEV